MDLKILTGVTLVTIPALFSGANFIQLLQNKVYKLIIKATLTNNF